MCMRVCMGDIVADRKHGLAVNLYRKCGILPYWYIAGTILNYIIVKTNFLLLFLFTGA